MILKRRSIEVEGYFSHSTCQKDQEGDKYILYCVEKEVKKKRRRSYIRFRVHPKERSHPVPWCDCKQIGVTSFVNNMLSLSQACNVILVVQVAWTRNEAYLDSVEDGCSLSASTQSIRKASSHYLLLLSFTDLEDSGEII